MLWGPPVPGEYTIIATFEGTDSYGPSFAETAIGVTEKPSPAAVIEPEQPAAPAPTQPEPAAPAPTEPTPTEPTTPEPTTPEQTTPEPTEPTTESAFITTEIAILAAVVVACVIGIVAFLALRKRQ